MSVKMKIFTLEEAERLLPILESLLKDFQMKYQKMEESSVQWELHHRRDTDHPPANRTRKGREELTRLEQEVTDIIKLMNQVGCVVRDPHEGLIDFPSVRDKEPVYLCWKLGEDRIKFYHGVDQGFQGRKPL